MKTNKIIWIPIIGFLFMREIRNRDKIYPFKTFDEEKLHLLYHLGFLMLFFLIMSKI